jgi:hypothetical protein
MTNSHDVRDDSLDLPVWGAMAIGVTVNLKERQAFYKLEAGLLDADKVGKSWVSTKRRLLAQFRGNRSD